MRIVTIVPGVVVLACALAWAPTLAQTSEAAASGLAPATVAAVQDMKADLTSAGEGRRLFLKLNCYGCHGTFAQGAIGPSIVHAPRSEVEFNVLNGNAGGMPSFRKYVDETDITNLANYLAIIGTTQAPTFMDWWKEDPKK